MLTSNYRPANIEADLWAELPAEVRLRYQRMAKRREWTARWAIRILLLPPLAYMALPPAQWVVHQLLPEAGTLIRLINDDGESLTPLDTSPLNEGDTVADTPFTITSGYGTRLHPTKGIILPHNGVDVDTPTGTPLYAPAVARDTVQVSCWWDVNGGGTVAEITSNSIPDYRFKALHLSSCKTGIFKGGQVFAETGDTGNGTGPHLDFRQLPLDSNVTISPQAGYLSWLLTGKAGGKAAESLRAAIKEEEGFRAEAYRDPGAGVPTIGYGATSYPDGTPVKLGDVMSKQDAEALLDWHIDQAATSVENLVTVPLSKNEKEALTDLTYNIGPDQLRTSSLLTCLNKGDRQCAADQFLEWDKSDGRVLPGLKERRIKNRELFLKPSQHGIQQR